MREACFLELLVYYVVNRTFRMFSQFVMRKIDFWQNCGSGGVCTDSSVQIDMVIAIRFASGIY